MSFLLAAALASGVWWTPAHARAVLGKAEGVEVVDRFQQDRPEFRLRFDRIGRLTPLGRARGNTWSAFRYDGDARDELNDAELHVRFTLRPLGRRRFAVTAFHGPPPDRSQPTLPLRAAFYYPWFPEAWDQEGIYPFTRYHPTLGFYTSSDGAVVRRHIQELRYGKFGAGIYSWWGQGTLTDFRFGTYLAASRQTPLRWAIYYELEGYTDPSPLELRADVQYVLARYGRQPAYLRIDGRPVVFVYRDVGDTCLMADRWRQATSGLAVYVVLFVVPGYRDCVSQPDGWHAYGADFSSGEDIEPGYSFTIEPGFWLPGQPPRFRRDLDRWKRNVRDMVASREPFQLVVSFSEWGEGTAVESAQEWNSPSGYGAYLDALHADGAP